MQTGALGEYLDVAQVALYVFWLFFFFLIVYLQRESNREGLPLVSDLDGKPSNGLFGIPAPKTFRLMGGKTAQAPSATIDKREPNATASNPFPGSPLIPNGDPMLAEVGPGAYALRADTPDVTYQGHDRIVPMRVATDFKIEHRDPDPRGMPVLGADGAQGGIVRDVWIDRSEYVIRYLEVEVAAKAGGNGKAADGTAAQAATRRVLLPINFCGVDRTNRKITVGAILGKQFANAPGLKSADRVTLLEEERICAYYGGGLLYATPDRQEPLL